MLGETSDSEDSGWLVTGHWHIRPGPTRHPTSGHLQIYVCDPPPVFLVNSADIINNWPVTSRQVPDIITALYLHFVFR